MKIYFLMSDINMGIVIAGGISIITLIFTTVIIPLINKLVAKAIEPFMNKVTSIHSEMNGMKDELVRSAKYLGEAIGELKGRADLKQEQKEDAAEAKTLPVEVVKPAEVIITENMDKEVIIKKNLDK